jgi:hypothetical protein
VVVDEAQNYAPEQHTGWLKEVKPAFDAVFRSPRNLQVFEVQAPPDVFLAGGRKGAKLASC